MSVSRKLLALLLCAALLAGLLPTSALAARMPFTDVGESAWYYEGVQYAYDHGLVQGTSRTTFAPGTPTTRAMLVTILHRLEGTPSAPAASFQDVRPGAWYADAVAWASSTGIVTGYSAERFGPSDTVTREQMATILYRFASYKGLDLSARSDLSGFYDYSAISSYARDALAWANAQELITGNTPTTINPKGNAPRNQTAIILMRFCRNVMDIAAFYLVSFDTRGGSEVVSQSINSGYTAFRPSDPTREGYVFDGWYEDEALTTEFDFSRIIDRDMTLYAAWTSLDVVIEIDPGDYGDEVVNRTITGTVSSNTAIATVTGVLSLNDYDERYALDLENGSFSQDVLLDDGVNTFTVTVSTIDGSRTSKSVDLTYDSGHTAFRDRSTAEILADDSLDLVPVTEEETPDEPDKYMVANMVDLYFDDDSAFADRISYVEDTLGGEVVGYLNSLSMVQAVLPDSLTEERILTDDQAQELLDSVDSELAQDILTDVDLEYVYPNVTIDVDGITSWDGDDTGWWIEMIDANDAWGYNNYYGLDYLLPIRAGVVDTGIRTDHEDLSGRVTAIGPTNIPQGHGTHVAGIITATAENRLGITGVLYNNSSNSNGFVTGYDVFDGGRGTSTSKMLEALTTQVERGAKVINYSIGSSGSISSGHSSVSRSSIDADGETDSRAMGRLLGRGFDFIVVQSAGNGNEDNVGVDYWNNGDFCAIDYSNCYSQGASYNSRAVSQSDIIDRIIVAANLRSDGSLSQSSNGGSGDLHIIAAPGTNIYSCVHNSVRAYDYKSGTSMAAPVLTAVAAQTWSVNQSLNGAQVVSILSNHTQGTARASSSGNYTTAGMGIVNSLRSVEAAIDTLPQYSGTVANAVDGSLIPDAAFALHKGSQAGPLVADGLITYDGGSGAFTLPRLPADTYTLVVSAPDYITTSHTFTTSGSPVYGSVNIGNIAMTPVMSDNEYRIILRWGETPSDLDSHLVATTVDGEYYHVFYRDQNPSPAYANLDWDDTTSYGPETITITDFSGLRNVRYAVHDYTNRGADFSTEMSRSGAYVEVFRGNALLDTYYVPVNASGTEWDVFALDANGNLVPMNQMTYQNEPDDVLR